LDFRDSASGQASADRPRGIAVDSCAPAAAFRRCAADRCSAAVAGAEFAETGAAAGARGDPALPRTNRGDAAEAEGLHPHDPKRGIGNQAEERRLSIRPQHGGRQRQTRRVGIDPADADTRRHGSRHPRTGRPRSPRRRNQKRFRPRVARRRQFDAAATGTESATGGSGQSARGGQGHSAARSGQPAAGADRPRIAAPSRGPSTRGGTTDAIA
jgi:hypothetical protein